MLPSHMWAYLWFTCRQQYTVKQVVIITWDAQSGITDLYHDSGWCKMITFNISRLGFSKNMSFFFTIMQEYLWQIR